MDLSPSSSPELQRLTSSKRLNPSLLQTLWLPEKGKQSLLRKNHIHIGKFCLQQNCKQLSIAICNCKMIFGASPAAEWCDPLLWLSGTQVASTPGAEAFNEAVYWINTNHDYDDAEDDMSPGNKHTRGRGIQRGSLIQMMMMLKMTWGWQMILA